ncbi:LPCAT2 isoform 7, partial [Pan troglodytes]
APHSTFFDGIACIVAGLPSMVSRNENAQVPLIGRLLRAVQPVLVSRVDPDSRKNTINEIIKRTTSGGEWPQILVFPEGTCTNRSCLITFKPGAFIPGVPVQPVLLRYPNKLDTVTWTWQGYTFIQLCMLTFCQLFTKVEVEMFLFFWEGSSKHCLKISSFFCIFSLRRFKRRITQRTRTAHLLRLSF